MIFHKGLVWESCNFVVPQRHCAFGRIPTFVWESCNFVVPQRVKLNYRLNCHISCSMIYCSYKKEKIFWKENHHETDEFVFLKWISLWKFIKFWKRIWSYSSWGNNTGQHWCILLVKGILSTVCYVSGMTGGIFLCVRGEIGRRTGFKPRFHPGSAGSTPAGHIL